MHARYLVIDRQRGVPVVVIGAGVLIRLFTSGIHQFFFSEPIIFVACRIYVVGDVAVVVGGKYHIEAFGEEVVFVVFERGHQRVSFAVFLPEYGFLSHTRLYLLVHVGVGESEHQTVGPVFIFYSDFGYDGFVVIGVVKPFYPFRLFGIEIGRPVFFVTFYRGIDVIVVVRVVLECVYFIRETVFERLTEIDIRLMCVKRAVRIRCVDKPISALFVGNDIDDSTQSIGSEPYGHDAFVYFDAVGKVYGDIIQPERAADSFLRHAIDEDFHVFPAEPVKRDTGTGTQSSRFSDFYTGDFGQ